MGACAETSCGKAYMEWQAVKEMNKRGVYTPDQVEKVLNKNWKKFNSEDNTFVSKEVVQSVCTEGVNYLGSIGNGITFDKESFDKNYKKIDPMGLEKNPKIAVQGLLTVLTKPEDDEKDKKKK
mmetsp:Transcript_14368/g.24462  ORF Transcript_14368/g.24462 Transcript_14368/m.24462 type:complete len:123 (-) Transcript_14368:100-468(-)|eukprot:CAMPEP_0168627306 /NCGR_PEP_ID=MMETSP0449_2-20121227/11161_1 /TAXON_ID=1082188 /ORGANISM="Strombidium rassoulzadegani, Strain ras09" /LENGTH=122 /DNA_ID=CAMNT_0008669491 /DNA_START=14 /DNA_END=382 /DNA_ORIENTATION=+